MTTLTALPPPVAAAAHTIWHYMQVGHDIGPNSRVDLIIALGSNDVRVAERAADLYLAGAAPRILFSGGVGALTRGQYDGVSEGEYFAHIAEARGVPRSHILVESASTNTGENIRFSRELLLSSAMPASVILVQKPFMERRTLATFLCQWPEDGRPAFLVTSPQITLADYPNPSAHRLALADVLETMCGDLQRIAVYPSRGFQVPMAIPTAVWEALHVLVREGFGGPQLMRVDGAPEGSRRPIDYVGLDQPPPDVPT